MTGAPVQSQGTWYDLVTISVSCGNCTNFFFFNSHTQIENIYIENWKNDIFLSIVKYIELKFCESLQSICEYNSHNYLVWLTDLFDLPIVKLATYKLLHILFSLISHQNVNKNLRNNNCKVLNKWHHFVELIKEINLSTK